MKVSFWDILSIFGIIGIIIIVAVVYLLFQNPVSPLNPFPPQEQPEALVLPTSTATPIRLPPTWTYTPEPTSLMAATLRPSATSAASPTSFIVPTMTPIAMTSMPTNTRMPLEGKCKIVTQTPSDGTAYKAGTSFKAKWNIQNTSDAMWDKSSVDVKFLGGEHMHVTTDVIDMPQSVTLDGTFDLGITMLAPVKEGYHITYWGLVSGNTTLCSFYVEIFTEK